MTAVLFLATLHPQAKALENKIQIVTEELPPYQMLADNQVTGISTQMVKAVATKAGLDYTIRVFPWARAYRMAQQEENVAIYSIIKTPERTPMFKWAGELAHVEGQFFKLKAREDIQVHALVDAKSFTTAIPREDIRHQFLLSREFKKNVHFYLVNDNATALKLLFAKGNIAMIIDDETTLRYMARQLDMDHTLLRGLYKIPELSVRHHIAFSLKTSDKTVDRFIKAFEEMKNDGTYDRLWQKWSRMFLN